MRQEAVHRLDQSLGTLVAPSYQGCAELLSPLTNSTDISQHHLESGGHWVIYVCFVLLARSEVDSGVMGRAPTWRCWVLTSE